MTRFSAGRDLRAEPGIFDVRSDHRGFALTTRARTTAIGMASGLVLLVALATPAAAQMDHAASGAGSASGPLSIAGHVSHPKTLTADDLRRLVPTVVAVGAMADHATPASSYTGVLLWTLVDQAAPVDEPGGKTRLRHVVFVQGRDGYSVALALGELDPTFEGKNVIVAYAKDGKPMPGLKLVVPGDKRAGRSVRDVVSIDVR